MEKKYPEFLHGDFQLVNFIVKYYKAIEKCFIIFAIS